MYKKAEYEYAIKAAIGEDGDIAIDADDESLVSCKGRITVANAIYDVTLSRKKRTDPPKKPLYTGTISLIDPSTGHVMKSEKKRRKRVDSGRSYIDKDTYASITFRCNSPDPKRISEVLRNQMDTLLLENEEQFTESFFKLMPPDQTTPKIAIAKHLDNFLSTNYCTSPPDRNLSRRRAIVRVFTELPDMPFCRMRKKDIDVIVKKANLTEKAVSLCNEFWEYLFRIGRTTGISPFTINSSHHLAPPKNAFRPSEIPQNVFTNFFYLLSKEFCCSHCVLALLTSGFSWTQVKDFKWRDVEFVRGYTDYAIVHMMKEKTITEKHDYSRPIIPDAAEYLHNCFMYFCNLHGENNVLDSFIACDDFTKDTIIDRSVIAETANNLLVRAGYSESLRSPGRPGIREPISLSLLTTNYQRMLISVAGLKDDIDTYSFLAGQQLNSSTFINYESHTAPEQQYRLYTILKPISVEKDLRKPEPLKVNADRLLFTAGPKTNHQVAQVLGTITLAPGQSISIRCPHGVTGHITKQ